VEDFFRALVGAARTSSRDVLSVLDRSARALCTEIDSVLFFDFASGNLTCSYASGARTERRRELIVHQLEPVLPARCALLVHPLTLEPNDEPVLPGDRGAMAAPMISHRRICGIWYAASSTRERIEDFERLARLVRCACEPYLLALEREADRNDATFDGLTGVLGPRAFRRRLHEIVAAAGETAVALWFVDTDRFKSVNDLYGHAAGDRVLEQMAMLLRERVGTGDLVGRKGGDEFCALLRERGKMRAIELAQGFCAAVRAHDFGVPMRMTASVGIATYPFDGVDAASLLQAADEAMYFAKRSGRDRVAYAVEGSGFALYE
jgi:two-component system cell cycle response regulator